MKPKTDPKTGIKKIFLTEAEFSALYRAADIIGCFHGILGHKTESIEETSLRAFAEMARKQMGPAQLPLFPEEPAATDDKPVDPPTEEKKPEESPAPEAPKHGRKK
jgi:hypothetical protein